MTKEEAHYTPLANGKRKCRDCGMFHDNRKCDLVDGDIAPGGYCRHWIKPKPKKVETVASI